MLVSVNSSYVACVLLQHGTQHTEPIRLPEEQMLATLSREKHTPCTWRTVVLMKSDALCHVSIPSI
jgi:hypothetical protein